MILACCPLQKKVESKVWRWYYWTFCWQKKLVTKSENVVNASVGLTEENSSWNRKRRMRWSTRSSLKEIVNFIFNKSTQETRRKRLSWLIPHKKETPRRRTNPKNWLQNELWHKITKNGILSLIKVKLSVRGWRHGFKQVSRFIALYSSSFSVFFLILLTFRKQQKTIRWLISTCQLVGDYFMPKG